MEEAPHGFPSRESLGTIRTYNGNEMLMLSDEEAHNAAVIKQAADQGWSFWGWSDTWTRKSEGGYTFYFMVKKEDYARRIGVNTFVFPVEEALKKYSS